MLDASVQAGRARDPDGEAKQAEAAFNQFSQCVLANGFKDGHELLRLADSLLLQGAARTIDGRTDEALQFLISARSLYKAVAAMPGASSAIIEAANHKVDVIEASAPATRTYSSASDLLIAMQAEIGEHGELRRAAAAAPDTPPSPVASQPVPVDKSPFTVLASWTSPGDQTYRLLHIRINVHPDQPRAFVSKAFRIRVTSPTMGTETVYAMDAPAPSYRQLNYSTNPPTMLIKRDVSPDEDFGLRQRIDLRAGDAATLVLTFPVRTDADLLDAAESLQYIP
jgi:hypothetical protein